MTLDVLAPPATAAWRAGEDPGRRRFHEPAAPLALQNGGTLPGARIAYETWGELNPSRDNAVLILHALTGDSHVTGPAGPGHPTPGWWSGLVGPGRAVDTDRYFVLAPNALGGCQGSTGPASPAPDGRPWGSRFPNLTLRDLAHAEADLADHLGITTWHAVLGGSLGGMRALDWAIEYPARVHRLLLLACTAVSSADQIAWCTTQIRAIESDPAWRGGDYHDAPPGRGPHAGLGLARRIAHQTYRAEAELAARFGATPQPGEDPAHGGRWAVESYLDHQARKLVHRFDAGSYVTLTRAMAAYDAGRDRGGVPAALSRVQARTLAAGVSEDRLFPLPQQQALADHIPTAGPLHVLDSPYGHDGFLVETAALSPLVADFLDG
ncbi:homoserine O-acetyltransferase [Crossiella equi]|uniref:Homoserine O-acetyltransferase n=1 Tax=Crossiella equi TaxID=130796 RepID=A0ABS5ANG2_9PSEU|nr:homoserine O-acetyltransferase [Crossiella equi]MBP2477951.1 homoserine O-acetyltransferase [Crossiella equi]